MIPLPSNCLVFKVAGDAPVPCNGQPVAVEVTGEAAGLVDAELLSSAAAGVLFYFRHEQKRDSVPAGEFCAALEAVLRGFGLVHIKAASPSEETQPQLAETDLRTLAGDGLELAFFQRLRQEMQRHLEPAPRVVRFHGLRSCVKQLTGARRWSPRCQSLNDHIVDYLRTLLHAEPAARSCGLVVH